MSEHLCTVCGLELAVGEFGCITTIRPHGRSSLRVVGDDIPGGMVIENLGPRPQTFYTKSSYRDAMRAANVHNVVRHRPLPGSDKSPHTQRFV